MSVVLIGNPVAGRASMKGLKRIEELIKNKGRDVSLLVTQKSGDAERFAREALKDSPSLIIVAGGDGTCNEVLNGIAGSTVPMAVLPVGTTNVLARELAIPFDIHKAILHALGRTARRVSLGRIAFQGSSRYFCLMAGIGYDADAVRGVGEKAKRISGKGAYIASGLRSLIGWNPGALAITLNGKTLNCYSAIVCNASKYAGPFSIAPDADIRKPLLYAFIMHGRRRLDILRYTAGILTSRHLGLKDTTYAATIKVAIEGCAPIQVDGDYIGRTPAVIEAVADALSLVY